ncbi:hypothetical protein [Micromonospora craniellae]|uniref:hypothetical protein n=1 Tax=Micromonospora craniellae TaxID=2294034 RepID=UPI0011C17ACA|nr:hypothetical protein [Micromonospora craniellae]QOC91446.1 hypothetical protein ID554_26315 [Micromonospora craniellae]
MSSDPDPSSARAQRWGSHQAPPDTSTAGTAARLGPNPDGSGIRHPARWGGTGPDGAWHPARSDGTGPDGARYPARWGAAGPAVGGDGLSRPAAGGDYADRTTVGGDDLSRRGDAVGRRRADGAFGDGLWPGAGLPARGGHRPSLPRGPWPDLAGSGATDVRSGDGRESADPWPVLPDDRSLWAVPDPEAAATAHLRRLDREQAGG